MTESYLEQLDLDLAGLDRNPLRWRSVLNGVLTGFVGLCVVVTLIPLALLLGYILVQGFQRLNWALLTELPPPPGFADGGIANANGLSAA